MKKVIEWVNRHGRFKTLMKKKGGSMKLVGRKAVKKTVAFAIDETTLERVKALARQNKISASDCFRQLLEKALAS